MPSRARRLRSARNLRSLRACPSRHLARLYALGSVFACPAEPEGSEVPEIPEVSERNIQLPCGPALPPCPQHVTMECEGNISVFLFLSSSSSPSSSSSSSSSSDSPPLPPLPLLPAGILQKSYKKKAGIQAQIILTWKVRGVSPWSGGSPHGLDPLDPSGMTIFSTIIVDFLVQVFSDVFFEAIRTPSW